MRILKMISILLLLCSCSYFDKKEETDETIDQKELIANLEVDGTYSFEQSFTLSADKDNAYSYLIYISGNYSADNGAFTRMDFDIDIYGATILEEYEWLLSVNNKEVSAIINISANYTQSFENDASMEIINEIFKMKHMHINYIKNYDPPCEFLLIPKDNRFTYKEPKCVAILGYEKIDGDALNMSYYLTISLIANDTIEINMF